MANRILIRGAVAGLAVIGLAVGGTLWWTHKQKYEDTDNAYVEADTVQVTPQIDGYVAEVLVGDNQQVQQGQVLVRIDAADARSRLDMARANVEAAGAGVRGVDDKAGLETAMIAQRQAALTSAEAAAEHARLDLARNSQLADKGFVSSQRLDEVKVIASEADAAVAQAKAALEAEKRAAQSLGSSKAQMIAQAQVAKAAADKAQVDTDRLTIRAPAAGVVGARSVRVGQYVRPGAAVMALVPLDQTYVVANFKETQVARLRIGQPVTIRADAFGNKTLTGHVQSFSPATGSEFALIPVENAVGNFTKITQRLPVRIAIDRGGLPGGALRPGLSVKVEVDVTHQTGASFAEALAAPQQARLAPSPAPIRP